MSRLGEEMMRAQDAGANMLHADVMDGVYVPNISFGFDTIAAAKSSCTLPIDAHMMTVCPQKYIRRLHESGCSMVTIHHDIGDEKTVKDTLRAIKEEGMLVGLALRPAFPASDIEPFLPYIDVALVMTVEPGFGGQKFMKNMLPKIVSIRKMAPRLDIQVDGGINAETAALCAAAGANMFVVGTASFRAPDMARAVASIRSAIDDALNIFY